MYRQSWSPFEKGGNFWMIPFLVPYLGSIIAVSVYSIMIEKLEVINVKGENATKNNIKFIGA